MFTIEFDQPRNLFVIRYSDHVGPDETERALEEVRRALERVERGFRLLADLTDLQSMDVACAPHIESAMEMFNKKGVTEVVRVIPDPRKDIGMQIMSYFHYGGEVRIVTYESADEAMTFLANSSAGRATAGSDPGAAENAAGSRALKAPGRPQRRQEHSA